MAGRLDNWTDPEIFAACAHLAAFGDWAQGAVSGVRATAQAQLDAELTRIVSFVPTQGTAVITARAHNVAALNPPNKIEQELSWRWHF